jgi:hypothetical protein
MRSAALMTIVLLCAALAGAAQASDEARVVVVRFADAGAGSSDSLRERLAEVVVTSISREGDPAEVAPVELDDVLALAGCKLRDEPCLKRLPATLAVREIVLARVEGDRKAPSLVVLRITEGQVRRSTHRLSGPDDDARVRSLEEALGVGEEPPPPVEEPPPPVEEPPPPVEEPPPPVEEPPPPVEVFDFPAGGPEPEERGFSFGRVRGTSWAILGGGAALALGSIVPYRLAASEQRELDALELPAPEATTVDHLPALEEARRLESRARTRYMTGNVLLIGGAVFAAAGASLVILQGRDPGPRDERPALGFAPAPGGGLVVTFSGAR